MALDMFSFPLKQHRHYVLCAYISSRLLLLTIMTRSSSSLILYAQVGCILRLFITVSPVLEFEASCLGSLSRGTALFLS